MGYFGHINGIKPGSIFKNRFELHQKGVHRPPQAGICGSAKDGAESIVSSGQYEDDEDNGTVLIYTGHGGRSQDSGKQVADQTLTRQNKALEVSMKKGLPVRVIKKIECIPELGGLGGYRYEGLYEVKDCWDERGISGFVIWRFRLEKINN